MLKQCDFLSYSDRLFISKKLNFMTSKIGIRSENEFRLLEKLLIRSKLVEKMKNPSLDPVLVLKEEVPIDSRYQTLICNSEDLIMIGNLQ